MTVTFHNPPTAPRPVGPYSNVAEVDLGMRKLLVLSGQTALEEAGTVAGGNDMGAQTRFVFDAIGAMLADRGATFADVVNVRTYLTDIKRIKEYTEARGTYFGDRLPTSTTVEVSGLVRDGLLLEVDITAVV